MRWKNVSVPMVFLVVFLGPPALVQAKSIDRLLTIIDDVEQPLVKRRNAVERLDRVAQRNRAVCVELARRTGFDPIGVDIFYMIEGGSCASKWGEEIARELLEEAGPERFTLWVWLSCDYLSSHPEVTEAVAALKDYDAESRLKWRLQECELDDQRKVLRAGPRLISYHDGTYSYDLQQMRGYIEVASANEYVYVTAADDWIVAPSDYRMFLTIPADGGNPVGALYIWGLEGGPCSFVGELIDGTVRVDGGSLRIDGAAFRGSACGDRGNEVSTIRISAENLKLWPVRGLYDYVRMPKRVLQLVPELESWDGAGR